MCSIAFDLIAYQCGGDPACVGASGPPSRGGPRCAGSRCWIAGWLAGNQLRQLAAAAVLPRPWSGCSASWPAAPGSATSRASRSGGGLRARRPQPLPDGHREGAGHRARAPWFWYGEPLARPGTGPSGGRDRGDRLEPGRRGGGAGRQQPLARGRAGPGLDGAGDRRGGHVRAPAAGREAVALGPPGAGVARPGRAGPGRRRLLVPAPGAGRPVALPGWAAWPGWSWGPTCC